MFLDSAATFTVYPKRIYDWQLSQDLSHAPSTFISRFFFISKKVLGIMNFSSLAASLDILSVFYDLQILLISTNIEMLLIFRQSWLQSHNSFLNLTLLQFIEKILLSKSLIT